MIEPESMKARLTWTTGLLFLIVMVAVGVYLMNLHPAHFGAYHDDGIYAVTAKALATGQGYRIISLPDQPAQTKYPPFYPFLLSLIWRAFPNFPNNLWPLAGLSVVLAALFLLISYAYLVRQNYASRGLALVIVALMAFNWRIILLAISLFSELTYMLLSLLALWAAERYLAEEKSWLGLITGLLLALTFLTRTIGVTLIAATAVYFLIKREYNKLATILLVSALLVGPWLIWQHAYRSPANTAAAIYYTDYTADFCAIVTNVSMLHKIIATNLFYLTLIFTPVVSLSLAYEQAIAPNRLFLPVVLFSFALIALGFLRRWLAGARLLDLYVTFYFGLLAILPYNSYDRYLLPLLPFLLLYLVTQARRFLPAARPAISGWSTSHSTAAAILLVLVSLSGYGYVVFVSYMVKGQGANREHAQMQQPVLRWIGEHTAPTDVVLSYRDPVVYLHTGRRATRLFLPRFREVYAGAQPSDLSYPHIFFDLIRDSHACYLILMAGDLYFEEDADLIRKDIARLITESPQIFTLEYEAPNSFAKIYRIHTAP